MALKFSTEGAGANLSLNFTNSQGNAGGTSIYGPVYWQVEYSTDRGELHRAARIGLLLPAVRLLAGSRRQRASYCAVPGYADRVFILPDALRNRPEVTLLIKARSTQCIASNTATVDQGDTGTITSDMAANKRSPMRFGTIAVRVTNKPLRRGRARPSPADARNQIRTTMKQIKSLYRRLLLPLLGGLALTACERDNGEETRVSEFGPYKKRS